MKSLFLSLVSAAALVQAQSSPQVQLGRTTVIGKLSGFSPTVETFQGLPYAKPPVGSLRLKPPVVQTSLNGTAFNASTFGPACLQPGLALNASSEDCLSLNVFRPAGTSANASLPVMFWVHGGGFTTGAGSVIIYDGTSLVNRSISRGTPSCLQSDNINSSSLIEGVVAAGAVSAATGTSPFQPVIDGKDGLIPGFLSQLKPKSPLPMISGSNLDEGTLFTPQNISSGDKIAESLISSSSPSPRGTKALTAASEEVLQLFPNIPALGSPYRTGNNTFGLDPNYKRFAAIFGDFVFQSARRSLSQDRSKAGVNVYSYHFTDPDANLPDVFSAPVAPGSIGITHSFELPYVFGALNLFGITSVTASNLSAIMQEYWLSFATSLDPNDGKGLDRPAWSKYTMESEMLIQLDGRNLTAVPDTYHERQIAFINKDPLLFRR